MPGLIAVLCVFVLTDWYDMFCCDFSCGLYGFVVELVWCFGGFSAGLVLILCGLVGFPWIVAAFGCYVWLLLFFG